jgi:hypothetical protein
MNIIELAKQAGFDSAPNGHVYHPDTSDEHSLDKYLEAFAALVETAARADEREACAKLVEDLPAPDIYSNTDKSMWDVTCMECADAIRARGTT